MASHTSPDYEHMEGSRIALGYGIDNTSDTGGESGGEVGESGDTVHTGVNTVPVQGSKWSREAWDNSWDKAKVAKEKQNPMRRKANTVGLYSAGMLGAAIVIGMMGGLIISAFIGAIGWIGIVTMLVMYLISPAWDR